jgi:DNA modification methylase
MLIEIWSIDRPKPYPNNARKWGAGAVDKVADSIRAYGFRQPIVVDIDGVIIIGHLRLAAAKKLRLKEVPVHVARDLTPAQVRGLRLMDNRSHEEAEWDFTLLAPELADLSAESFDLALTGFDVHELDALLRDPMDEEKAEQAPPLPEVAVTRPGDLWLLGPHRVLCSDATNPDSVGRLLGECKPKLLVTDPPYGVSLDSEWRDRAGLNGHGPAEPSYMKHRTAGHRNTSISSDTRADWSEAYELVPSIQVAYIWHASVYAREVLNGLERIGFLYPQQIIWNKGRAVLTRTHYWYGHEPCLYVRKKNAPWHGKAGENSTVWEVASPKFIMGGSDEAKFDHPTQKPLELMRRPMLNHTKRGELVYDAFLGSGTTLMAAELTERVCIGMELDPKYADVIVQRWQEFTGKQATLDGANKSFEQVSAERLGIAVAVNEKAPPGTKPSGAKGRR